MVKERLTQIATAVVVGASAVSPAGVDFIASHEGKRNVAYPDPAWGKSVPTICYGHTLTAQIGQWRSDAECLDLLHADANAAAQQVLRLVKVPLTQGELDAYTSFVFNVGQGKFGKSTALRLLNSGDRAGACMQLGRWVYANGVRYNGLVTRRAEETKLCLRDL